MKNADVLIKRRAKRTGLSLNVKATEKVAR